MLVSDKLWCGWELVNLDIKIEQFITSVYGRGRARLFASPAVSSYLSCDQKKKKKRQQPPQQHCKQGKGWGGWGEWGGKSDCRLIKKKKKENVNENESNDNDNKS